MHDIFYVSLLEYDMTKKKQVEETTTQLEFKASENKKEYKVEEIWDNAVYSKELEIENHL